MTDKRNSADRLLQSLQERAKELDCLYQVEEVLSTQDVPIEELLPRIAGVLPAGFQHAESCSARIDFEGRSYRSNQFTESKWALSADIAIQDVVVGMVSVYYLEEKPEEDIGPFFREEQRLINTVADRLGHRIIHHKMRQIAMDWRAPESRAGDAARSEWSVVLEMLKQTDVNLYLSVARKMLNQLCWSGVSEAKKLLRTIDPDMIPAGGEELEALNQPHRQHTAGLLSQFSKNVFDIAAKHMSDTEVFNLIQKWIQEDKLSFLVQVVNRNLSLAEVADAIRRYHHLAQDEPEVASPSKRGVRVSLIRRFLSDQLSYISVAKSFIGVGDFYDLLQSVIFSAESHGKLGGKAAGLVLAYQILRSRAESNEQLANIRLPKTWFITSDVLLHFMHYNNFDEVVEQKYKEINQVRLEYPHVVQSFKAGRFPPDIMKNLSVALDDFGERPLIVRSSSLLEDRIGASFSGKYKSLFLANQGSKRKRLNALTDAIAEVYASTFGPDPIEYRAERGLIDFGEEMGIIIQEVVGNKIDKYFLPSFAGVAFSSNEFRWSPRIKREDGLLRLVPGLGTRAVDRLSDDYPVLIAPGQPGLRVNASPEEAIRYSPQKIDVINLETNEFETRDLHEFYREVGMRVPGIAHLVSVNRDGILSRPMGMGMSLDDLDLVVTFDGLVSTTPFVKEMHTILQDLQETFGFPIDLEFAHDGSNLYLLQCRSQSHAAESRPTPIPKDPPEDRVLFSARRYVSNGRVPDITHIVYVDPRAYAELGDRNDMLSVGRAVSKLNKVLPKRRFILMGPGRWGSRGDIKLGVSVTYSDINNTAMLIEVARKTGNYVPDLSFGTHFFQDLVEAQIRYLPLYPDDPGIVFNERFFQGAGNILSKVAPEFAHLEHVVKLIDVPQSTAGSVLRVLMNADLDQALAILGAASTDEDQPAPPSRIGAEVRTETFWRWRMRMVERMAQLVEPQRSGVQGMYVFGSTKNASAGPGSDIDLLVHFRGDSIQLERLQSWLNGWSLCLDEINYMRTGYRAGGLLDVHIVTDDDIAKRTSYAAKIGAVTDPARPLKMTPNGST